MNLDIVFVTYNSKKWLKGNLESILKSNFDLKNKISLYYYDNASTDDTYDELCSLKKKYEDRFKNFEIIKGRKNKGFGIGNNRAAKVGNSEYILILNTETEVYEDTFKKLEEEIKKSKEEEAVFELKQTPYEHPKYYDPLTGYTSWSSGACMVVKRDIFSKIHGFDKNLFMYCEDVEISWRIRQLGYKLKYLWNVPIIHYSYTEPYQFKETQFVFGYINNLYLRCKYGSLKNALKGQLLVTKALLKNKANYALTDEEYIKVKKRMRKEYFKMFFKYIGARVYKHCHKNKGDFKPKFYNLLDYEVSRINPFYNQLEKEKIKKEVLVSIIVRTCGRPNVLRENLLSLRNQTYKNFEVVIVEDGKNTAEEMIKKEFSDLNITYKATGKNVGRSKVGNIALSLSKGKYLNFLDDDDLFFSDHIERLVTFAENNNYDIVYDTAFETAINVLSKNPYEYKIENVVIAHQGNYSKLNLFHSNLFPIQTVMFSRKVYEKCGGFDEKMDALEDWDLWIRYSFDYTYNYIEDTTSLYRVPAIQSASLERQQFIDSYLDYMMKKLANHKIDVSIQDLFYFNIPKSDE